VSGTQTDVDARNRATSAEQTRRFANREVATDVGYLSADTKHVTTWTGERLGVVQSLRVSRSGFPDASGRRPQRYHARVKGIDGRVWIGTGPGPSMYMRLRLAKTGGTL